jgi:hypothetical protein
MAILRCTDTYIYEEILNTDVKIAFIGRHCNGPILKNQNLPYRM